MIADNKQKQRRLRLLVRKLNKERKRQGQKIDILCNDLIAAQRDFIKKLNVISFTAGFYESILGSTGLENLLQTAAGLIKTEIADANVTFFLRHEEDFATEPGVGAPSGIPSTFELHMFENDLPITFKGAHWTDCTHNRLEDYFSPELMDGICKSNKVCTLDDMFAMGLEGNLAGLNSISAVTIPLALHGVSQGFMLVYRSSENRLSKDEIDGIRAIAGGLCRAIASCQTAPREETPGHSRASD
jgi:hypothetical protein